MTAEITKRGMLDCQVCVPHNWTDEEVRAFAEVNNPCGTASGWQIRREGGKALNGQPERIRCESRAHHVHILLDA
jgi:hypothetical protein